MNKLLTTTFAALIAVGSLTSAHADEMNIKVAGWDAIESKLTTAAGTIIYIDPAKVTIPETLSVGDSVLIDFDSSEDGFTGITAFTITNDM